MAGSASARYQAGGAASGLAHQCPQRQHEHEIQQSVEDGVLARFLAGDLGGEQIQRGPGPPAGGHHR